MPVMREILAKRERPASLCLFSAIRVLCVVNVCDQLNAEDAEARRSQTVNQWLIFNRDTA
jgi:hypothetical protein